MKQEFEVAHITMAEFWGLFYKKYNERTADYWLKKFKSNCVPTKLEIYVKARKFKIDHSSRDLSITDCIGYIYAKQNNYTFVTGDKEFENFDNVEFIK